MLGRFLVVMFGVKCMAMRRQGVMRGFRVIARFVVFRRFVMVLRGVLVVFSGFLVMFVCCMRHVLSS
jgi:hypothetical protein